jgi:chromosome segregation ATPase
MMESPRSAEEIRKIELSLEELVNKFKSRVHLIREDMQSLINELESLRVHIGELRKTSNDRTREISDLTNESQSLSNELNEIQGEQLANQTKLDKLKEKITEFQSLLTTKKNHLSDLESEKSSLDSILKKDEVEFTTHKSEFDELQPGYELKIKTIQEDFDRLKSEKDLLDYKYKAIRILSKSYLHTPEVNLVRFLAQKPSPNSSLTEIKSALGIDPVTLNSILDKLSARNVLAFDPTAETIEVKVKIDLFDQEV